MAIIYPETTMGGMNTPVWTFQDRLRKAREHAGMTQSELATATGISLNSLNRYEKGQRSPNNEVIQAIAEATGVSVEWLTKDDDPALATPTPLKELPANSVIRWTPEGFKISHDS